VPDAPSAGDHRAATGALDALAAKAAGVAPLVVPADRLLYVLKTGAAEARPVRHEMWVQTRGGYPLRIRVDGKDMLADPAADAARRAEQFAAQGPSLLMPTPQFLAGLPTDQTRLLDLLRDGVGAAKDAAWSVDRQVFGAVRTLLASNEPLLTPAVRAALYRALAQVPSVWAAGQVTVTIGGRTVVAIGQSEQGGTELLLFDQATGRVVGAGSCRCVGSPAILRDFQLQYAAAYGFWQFAVASSVDVTPSL
jgi:hypothetical protein